MAKSIDPHKVFANKQSVQLDELNFFAELTVTKRNRLTSSTSDKPLVINFSASTNGEYTTNWTELKENFGIKSINMRITSSYVPQVDIVFEDIGGQALFNNFGVSKYKTLFDMPPPIFDLKLKGYYGQAVSYRLHMVKQSTKFVNNNSFEITASFVGMTFAPLTDMYIDYLKVAPYLSGEANTNGDFTFLELCEKSRQLTNNIKNVAEKDVQEMNNYGEINSTLISIQNNYKLSLYNKINELDTSRQFIYPYYDKADSNIIKVGYKFDPSINETPKYPRKDLYDSLYDLLKNEIEFLSKNNIKYKVLKDIISYDKLPNLKLNQKNFVDVFSINLANIDNNIRDAIKQNQAKIDKIKIQIDNNVNKIQIDSFNGKPTLNRILNIVINDAKKFFKILKGVVDEAERIRVNNNDTSNGDALKYAFPNYYAVQGDKKILSIPPESFTEVQFINRYINAKLKAIAYIESQWAVNFDPNSGNDYTFMPINAFDSILDYQSIFNTIKKPDEINDMLFKRALILFKMSYNIPSSLTLDGVKAYAKLEAANLMAILKKNEILLNSYLQIIDKDNFKFVDSISPTVTSWKNKTLNEITFNNNQIVYKPTNNFKIRTADDADFANSLGIPVIKTNLVDGYEVINKSISLKSSSKSQLCQYNIPFFKDERRSNDGENYSDFVKRSITISSLSTSIFKFNNDSDAVSKITNADKFLEQVYGDRILTPFETIAEEYVLLPYYRNGIYEVPRFVFIMWGYMYYNQKSPNWKLVNKDISSIFLKYYNEFKSYFDKNFSSCLPKLKNAEEKDGENDAQNEFFQTDFMVWLNEIQYMSIGDWNIFSNSALRTLTFDNIFSTYEFNIYLDTLKQELLRLKVTTKKDIVEEKREVQSQINNLDLKRQLYYTFKSFVDKWMLNTPENIDKLLNNSDAFNIDNFLVVDRAFNSIGDDVVVDLSPIYSNETTSDTNLYSFLLNLLSKNNFEFFALPSYIEYGKNNLLWNEENLDKVFGTYNNVDIKTDPKFICMYVGGTSSQLDINNDGTSHLDDSDKFENINDFGNQVQAFRVDFGTNTQSFFTNLELDQLEFKETNESIKILDNIANRVDVTTSNSLYNTYEQRSYTATITMLGNFMIQPTMYFDLHNVAMFKGTYLILEVNHKVEANNVYTIFKGVRVPKVAKPYVKDYLQLNNVDGYNPKLASVNSGSNVGNAKITSNDLKDVRKAIKELGKIKTNKIGAQEKAFLDVISYAEGTLGFDVHNGYNCLFGHKKIPAWTPDYKMGHGLKYWQDLANGNSAAGRYQYLDSTWLGISIGTDSLNDKSGKNKAFSAENQDLTCVRSINERLKPNGLKIPTAKPILESEFVKYTDCLAREWASFPFYGVIPFKRSALPSNWTPGSGYYPGQGGKYSKEELWLVYNIALNAYNGNVMSESDINALVAKINARSGDSNGGKAVNKLIDKYGKLDVLHTNMTNLDRVTDKNKKFIDDYIIKWNPPADIKANIPALPSTIEINKDLKAPLEKTFRDLISKGLHTEIKTFDGCFNIRTQRNSSVISTHAYAMAIDLNAATNPFGGKTTFSENFIKTWENNQFVAGARFGKGREDGMHYEYTINV